MFKFIFIVFGAVSVLFGDMVVGIPGGYKKVFVPIINRYNATFHKNIRAIYGPLGFLITQAKLKQTDLIMGEKNKLAEHNFKKFIPAGRGKLVILSEKEIKNIKDLYKIQLLAVPDPRHTIYGKAAAEAFKNLHLNLKTVTVSLMPQGVNYLLMGNTDGAVANLTQALFLKKLHCVIIPQSAYTPIILGFVKVSNNKQNDSFIKYIKSKKIQNILKHNGL